MQHLPPKLAKRLTELGAALDLQATGLLAPARTRRATFRLLRSDPPGVLDELAGHGLRAEPVDGLESCYAVPRADREALTHSEPANRGDLYVQGAASQRAARTLGVRPGDRVLDLAAAPGGKTLVLADALRGPVGVPQGELVAVEAVTKRFHRLRANLERAGLADFVETVLSDGRRVPRAWDDRFDRVLLDAPCSSEARIDPADPETWARWSLGKIRDMARKQWGLLGAALRCVRPGGEVVYCTCSFAPEENEATIAAWLSGTDIPVEALPIDLGDGVTTRPGLTSWGRKRWPEACGLARRIVPDQDHEGLFVARLRRTS